MDENVKKFIDMKKAEKEKKEAEELAQKKRDAALRAGLYYKQYSDTYIDGAEVSYDPNPNTNKTVYVVKTPLDLTDEEYEAILPYISDFKSEHNIANEIKASSDNIEDCNTPSEIVKSLQAWAIKIKTSLGPILLAIIIILGFIMSIISCVNENKLSRDFTILPFFESIIVYIIAAFVIYILYNSIYHIIQSLSAITHNSQSTSKMLRIKLKNK